MAQMKLSTKQKQTHRHREKTCGCQGRVGINHYGRRPGSIPGSGRSPGKGNSYPL